MDKKLGEYTLNELAEECKKDCSENKLCSYISCTLCQAINKTDAIDALDKEVKK